MFPSSTRSSCSVWSSQVDLIILHGWTPDTFNIRNSNGDLSSSDRLDHVSWRARRPAAETEAVLCRCRGELIILIIIIIIIITTRPKPAYGRQGLDWIVGPGYSFVVFSTIKTIETNQKPRKTMKPPWKTMETNQKPWKTMKPRYVTFMVDRQTF